MCEGYEENKRKTRLRNREIIVLGIEMVRGKGKLLRDEVTEEAGERKLIKTQNFK